MSRTTPYCDWCEQPLEDDVAVEWHGSVGHHRCIVRAAVEVWASRQIEGEKPPPINTAALQAVRKAGICAWCFEPVGDQRSELNGGIGHPECTRHVWDCMVGDDAMPWPIPEPSTYESVEFLQRLGREAAKLGIDRNKLTTAILRASGDV
jgi:hypothetical protein